VCLVKFLSKNATDTCVFDNIFAGDCLTPL
jgi:hypothetical protein